MSLADEAQTIWNGRCRRVERDAPLRDVNFSLFVDRKGQEKIVAHHGGKVARPLYARRKLWPQCCPGDEGWLLEMVQTESEPRVNVERPGVVVDLSDSALV